MCVNAISCLVTETVLVGAVPTEIGQLAQLKKLNLGDNELIGVCTGNSLDYNGIRVYRELKKTFLLRRQHSHGIRLLHSTGGALSERQRIDR